MPVDEELLHSELLALREKYLPVLEKHDGVVRPARDSLVPEITPTLATLLLQIVNTVPRKYGHELWEECSCYAVEALMRNGVFALNAETQTGKGCFNYLYTMACRAVRRELDKLVKQRRAETAGLDYAFAFENDMGAFTTEVGFSDLAAHTKKHMRRVENQYQEKVSAIRKGPPIESSLEVTQTTLQVRRPAIIRRDVNQLLDKGVPAEKLPDPGAAPEKAMTLQEQADRAMERRSINARLWGERRNVQNKIAQETGEVVPAKEVPVPSVNIVPKRPGRRRKDLSEMTPQQRERAEWGRAAREALRKRGCGDY